MMFIAPFSTFTGSLGAWLLYSQLLKIRCHPASVHNTIVSQTRPEGNTTLMQELVDTLPSLTKNASLYSHYIWGTSSTIAADGSVHTSTSQEQRMKRLGKNMAVDSESLAIFSTIPVPNTSLSTLVHSKPNGRLVVDPVVFKTWMERLAEASSSNNKSTMMMMITPGSYTYTFRDYWNNEESFAMQIQRGSILRWKLRSARPTEFKLHQNGTCTLTDHYVIKGIIPMSIQWVGHLVKQGDNDENTEESSKMTIVWTSTVLHKGWKRLGGKTIDRPPMAEMYRQQPWNILFHDGELLVMERVGIGRLVFCRDDNT